MGECNDRYTIVQNQAVAAKCGILSGYTGVKNNGSGLVDGWFDP